VGPRNERILIMLRIFNAGGAKMTDASNSADEVVHSAEEAAEIKKSDVATLALAWHANLWGDVPAAIAFANAAPLSQAGTIVFNIRDNGQVWTYDLH
jgi:hypothetical protein